MALYSYKLANALADRGLQVNLFVDDRYELDHLPSRFNKTRVLSRKNVSFTSRKRRSVRIANIIAAHFYNWYKFYRYIQRDRPEIVHIQPLFYLVDWFMLRFLKRTGITLVITVHDVVPHKFYTQHFVWLELVILQYIYNKADKLIVHAETNKEQLLASFSIDESKVIVIPHGEYSLHAISQEISETKARSILGLDEGQRPILFFGFIRKIKGIGTLLEAFDNVAETFPNIVLIIAGSVIQGESFAEHRQVISRMKHKSQVKCFIKYVEHEEIAVFFTSADIVVVPYLEFSSQSGVLHLAQGFGKAVIGTDVGGIPEAIEDGKTGLVVPAGDVEGLAKAMSYLLENEEVRTRMGQRAKEMAMERFSWDAIAKATIEKAYS